MRNPLTISVAFVVMAAACDSGDRAPRADATDLEGTARMAAELRRIHERAVEDPTPYFHLNGRRAELLAAELPGARGSERIALQYRLANELLQAGRTQAAIETLARLLEALGDSPSVMQPANRPVFELLAVAHMRLGEQGSCIADRPDGGCVLPFETSGLERTREAWESAARLYERLLGRDPRDLASRWLLNVAHMALGSYPERVPERFRIDGLGPEPGAELPRFRDVAADVGVDVVGLSGGVCAEDFTGDGFLDLLVTSYGLSDPVRFFAGDGAGGFVERTEEAGLTGIASGLNAVHADYDNDGDADVLVLRGAWLGEHGAHPNSLLRNDEGVFTDVTFEAGLGSYHPTQVAAWGDVDDDGWVDLFIGNESGAWSGVPMGGAPPGGGSGGGDPAGPRHPSELYLNNGDGTFTDVASSAGLAIDAFVKGAAWGDVDGDGRIDLYVSVLGGPNRLYMNRSEPGAVRFEERAEAAGVARPIFSFPVWFFDYDDDGRDDLLALAYDARYMSGVAHEVAAERLGLGTASEKPRLYRNNGDGTFADVTAEAGLDRVLFAMGSNFGDLDNDGRLDIYVGTGSPDLRSMVPNRMFAGDGRAFREVTFRGGFGHIGKGHGVAFADFDRDGDQDVYAVMGGAVEGDVAPNVLFENPGPPPDHAWVTLTLEGRTANRAAIGARLRLVARMADGARRALHRTVGTGGSFGSSSLQQEIGLGPAVGIDTLEVAWPNAGRTTTVLTDLPVRRHLRVVEGAERAEGLERPPVPFRRAARAARPGPAGGGEDTTLPRRR